jgi:galactokinase
MTVSVPGRVNLIGEHIDYHNLPVLPMAIQRRVSIEYQPRADSLIRAGSASYPDRQFALSDLALFPPGDWGNYLKAAVQMIAGRWTITRGIDAHVASDLPSAAGLSSSSALLTGFALALLRCNEIEPSLPELLDLLPDGEQLVGTRGGGMDHAAVLASRPGSALLIHFAPFQLEPVAIPVGWTFLVAHSLTSAQKSGALKAEYNARRTAGTAALRALGFSCYQDVLAAPDFDILAEKLPELLPRDQRNAFLHVTGEARRVRRALDAIRRNEAGSFGKILLESHASLRDHLRVSNPTLDALVTCAMDAGALGARLTGAGFGGCTIILCETNNSSVIQERLIRSFFAVRPGFVRQNHLFEAIPSTGAIHA